jgi:DNA replicative helicase MCM subunit Mcm2 (Cdc46/Mcm family)
MFIDAEECKGKLHEWIGLDKTKKFIKRRFIRFLNDFCLDSVDRVYYRKWQHMLHENKQSIEISYDHFKEANPILALWLGVEPAHLLPELNAILYTFLSKKSPAYRSMVQEVYVKFFGMPVHDRIRELRVEHIGKLVNSTRDVMQLREW